MNETDKETLFDVRTINRRVSRGDINEAEYGQWLAELEDCSDMAEVASVRMVASSAQVTLADDLEEDR